MGVDNLKNDFKHFLLKRANIQRVHIVGCARSGTSMLLYSMIAFQNTIIYDKETSLWNHPGMMETMQLYWKYLFQHGKFFFITKRGATWWLPEKLARLIHFIRKYNIFLINIIRDPRDVLTSNHPLDKKRYYVEPSLWKNTMGATDTLMNALKDYPDKLTIRYEDIILDSECVQSELKQKLGLTLRSNIKSWKRMEEYVKESSGVERMIPYMHKLRNFDPNTIGKWKNDEKKMEYVDALLTKSSFKKLIREYMQKYGYEI